MSKTNDNTSKLNKPEDRPLTDIELDAVTGGKGGPIVSEIVVTKPMDVSSTR